MGYMKSLIVFFMITLLTATAAHRHRQRKQNSGDLIETFEIESDQRAGNGHGQGRNHRGRGGHHNNQGEMRGNVGFNMGIPDGYPIKGPVQQPLIVEPSHGRGKGPHRFNEPQNNFQQSTQNFQGPQQPFNNLQQQQNNFPHTQNNNQGPNNMPFNTNPSNPSNPFLPQQGSNQQHPQIQPSTQGENIYSSQILPSTSINKQNPQVFEAVTNELPATVKPLTTTPSYANPRRTDLLYGSNILEENKKPDGKTSDNPDIDFDERGLFDSAPHCQSGHILVNNRCRLQV